MSQSFPTYHDEQKEMFREEDHDCLYNVCPTCKEYITEDNCASDDSDGDCYKCYSQKFEFECLEMSASRVMDELSDALDDYRKGRVSDRQTSEQRITFETLGEALAMIRGALK